jgi:hypothetical protein
MTRRSPVTTLAVFILACGGDPGGEAVVPDQSSPPGAAGDVEGSPVQDPEGSGSGAAVPAPAAGELPRAEPVVAQIFDTTEEPSPPRRVTYHVLVARDAGRDALRVTLGDLLTEQAEADPALVAARAIGYYGVQTSATEADMVPFVWAEWLPPDGWYNATAASRDALHRLYFYPETAPQW